MLNGALTLTQFQDLQEPPDPLSLCTFTWNVNNSSPPDSYSLLTFIDRIALLTEKKEEERIQKLTVHHASDPLNPFQKQQIRQSQSDSNSSNSQQDPSSPDNSRPKLPPPLPSLPPPHVFFFGFQEVDLTAGGLLKQDTGKSALWRDALGKVLNIYYTSRAYTSRIQDEINACQRKLDKWRDFHHSKTDKSEQGESRDNYPSNSPASHPSIQPETPTPTVVQQSIWSMQAYIDQLSKSSKEPFVCIQDKQFVGVASVLFVRRELVPFFVSIETKIVGTGFMKTMGNKGGIGISLQLEWKDHSSSPGSSNVHSFPGEKAIVKARIQNFRSSDTFSTISSALPRKTTKVSLCMLNAHLAAGSKQFKRRLEDYSQIMKNMIFTRLFIQRSPSPSLLNSEKSSLRLSNSNPSPLSSPNPISHTSFKDGQSLQSQPRTRAGTQGNLPHITSLLLTELIERQNSFRSSTISDPSSDKPKLTPLPPAPLPAVALGRESIATLTDDWEDLPLDQGGPDPSGAGRVFDHDLIFFIGDLNFRVTAPMDNVHGAIQAFNRSKKETWERNMRQKFFEDKMKELEKMRVEYERLEAERKKQDEEHALMSVEDQLSSRIRNPDTEDTVEQDTAQAEPDVVEQTAVAECAEAKEREAEQIPTHLKEEVQRLIEEESEDEDIPLPEGTPPPLSQDEDEEPPPIPSDSELDESDEGKEDDAHEQDLVEERSSEKEVDAKMLEEDTHSTPKEAQPPRKLQPAPLPPPSQLDAETPADTSDAALSTQDLLKQKPLFISPFDVNKRRETVVKTMTQNTHIHQTERPPHLAHPLEYLLAHDQLLEEWKRLKEERATGNFAKDPEEKDKDKEKSEFEIPPFLGFHEGPITFLPSYKMLKGTNKYYKNDEKPRVPSWCDRVLWTTGDEMAALEKKERREKELRTIEEEKKRKEEEEKKKEKKRKEEEEKHRKEEEEKKERKRKEDEEKHRKEQEGKRKEEDKKKDILPNPFIKLPPLPPPSLPVEEAEEVENTPKETTPTSFDDTEEDRRDEEKDKHQHPSETEETDAHTKHHQPAERDLEKENHAASAKQQEIVETTSPEEEAVEGNSSEPTPLDKKEEQTNSDSLDPKERLTADSDTGVEKASEEIEQSKRPCRIEQLFYHSFDFSFISDHFPVFSLFSVTLSPTACQHRTDLWHKRMEFERDSPPNVFAQDADELVFLQQMHTRHLESLKRKKPTAPPEVNSPLLVASDPSLTAPHTQSESTFSEERKKRPQPPPVAPPPSNDV
ncbi:hypothetical protein BLNAU_5723 [Blattamonas nauphoetae]|uniref:Inositol polyphosphate-related phosphatase domain-containing protein n=1 Tax=Blattamonas nauphoetae TaxID=2049346 RepID=A0ABQ9Y6W2_9EUKA|nr:hypothetical protein BLNAU_5723 [Blattamonas nauphoetae]